MAGVISFLTVLIISISIVKVASIMLKHTGMSEDMARFQARSAYTGTGFTTVESEAIDWLLSKLVQLFFKRFTRVYAHDYDSLLFLGKDYEVVKFAVDQSSWLADLSMKDGRLNDEGILVLGIQRSDGYYVAVPRGETIVYAGDEIIVYGRESSLHSLMERKRGEDGDMDHIRQVEIQLRQEGKPADAGLSADNRKGSSLVSGIRGLFFRRTRTKSRQSGKSEDSAGD